MSKAIFCIVSSEQQARDITARLRQSGIPDNAISVLFPDKSRTREFAIEQQTNERSTTVNEVGSGAAIGGALGWVIGIAALSVPGVGPFIAAGPIISLLTGAGLGAALGGLTGALIGLGISESLANRYAEHLHAGKILVSVHSDERIDLAKARSIFTDANAQDIAQSVDSEPKAKSANARASGSDQQAPSADR